MKKLTKKSPINISRCQPSHNMPRAFKDNKPGVFEIEGDLNSCLDFGKKKSVCQYQNNACFANQNRLQLMHKNSRQVLDLTIEVKKKVTCFFYDTWVIND